MFKQQSSKYSLFLMELIIVIFFFTVASAVCVQLYAEAHILSTSTRDLNISITKVAGAAEVIKSSPMNPEVALLSAFDGSTISGQTLKIGYNKEWQVCSLNEALYIMSIDWQKIDQVLFATILMVKGDGATETTDNTVYRLDVVKHIPITVN